MGLGRRGAGRSLLAYVAVWLLAVNDEPVESFSVPFHARALRSGRCTTCPDPGGNRFRFGGTPARVTVVARAAGPVAEDAEGGSHGIFKHAAHDTEMETYCPDPRLPRGKTLYPAPEGELPPLIHHIKTHRPWDRLSRLICSMTDLEEGLVSELISFGAVYLSVPLPERKRNRSADGMSKAVRVTEDVPLPTEAYVRVHVNPRRHPKAIRDDWHTRIVASTDDAYVIDKPAGVPIVPTVDNLVESALFQASKGAGEDLFVTSRLDGCTSGIVILARSVAAAERYNKCIREGKTHKMYRLLCQGTVDAGKVQHGYKKLRGRLNAKPTLLSDKFGHGRNDTEGNVWQLAELDVVWCKPMYQGPAGEVLYECLVELLTGRTHQIRLQFAAMSAPLVGDSRYEPASGLLDEGPDTAWGDGSELFGPGPEQICLQASRVDLCLDDATWVSYEAGEPWWHDLDLLKDTVLKAADWTQYRGPGRKKSSSE